MKPNKLNDFNLSSYIKKLNQKTSKIEEKEHKEKESLDKATARENLYQEKENAFYFNEDDKLYFYDFYKINSTVWSYPNEYTFPLMFIPFMLYMTPSAFGFKEELETYVPWGFTTFIILFLLTFGVPVLWTFIRSLRSRHIYNNLTFKIVGLGKLIHRCKGLKYFRRCSISITWNLPEEKTDFENKKELELTLLKLLAGEAKRIRLGKHIFNNAATWTVMENRTIGFANWDSANRILNCLYDNLTPLQQRLGIIHSLVIEFPENKFKSEDYFEWSPEGD